MKLQYQVGQRVWVNFEGDKGEVVYIGPAMINDVDHQGFYDYVLNFPIPIAVYNHRAQTEWKAMEHEIKYILD